jgi:hypothetical protein
MNKTSAIQGLYQFDAPSSPGEVGADLVRGRTGMKDRAVYYASRLSQS